MSAFNDIDVTCSDCGEEFRGTVWTAIHAKEDPELKELLQGGEINLLACPECGDVFFYEHFLLYQDPSNELLAYVYPEKEKENHESLERMMLQAVAEAQAALPPEDRIRYKPMIFFGLESLVEFLHLEDEAVEQSDIAEAVCTESNIAFYRLPADEARRRQVPRILPRLNVHVEAPVRGEVLEGLKKLLDANPMLTHYQDLQKFIQDTPAWSL